MKLPSITNATMTLVATAGLPADYDLPAAAGATKWSGSERVNVVETQEIRTKGGTATGTAERGFPIEDVIVLRTVVVDAALGIDWQDGDYITFQQDDIVGADNGTVQSVKRTTALGLGGVVRVILNRA